MNAVAERRSTVPTVITVNEAAYVAGVSVKTVNQAIDREQIPVRELRRETDRAGRGVDAADAVYLRVRQVVAPEMWPWLHRSLRGKTLTDMPRQLEAGKVVFVFELVLQETEERLALLTRIRERVEADREVRGGEPVFRGTRTPVYGVARKLELGSTLEELKEDHPHLQDEDFELATQYVKLYPRRGRPRNEWTRGLKR
jgi:uncharacterized protein (DUF433 family)